MKGLRPLHSTPKYNADFIDNLRAACGAALFSVLIKACRAFKTAICIRKSERLLPDGTKEYERREIKGTCMNAWKDA